MDDRLVVRRPSGGYHFMVYLDRRTGPYQGFFTVPPEHVARKAYEVLRLAADGSRVVADTKTSALEDDVRTQVERLCRVAGDPSELERCFGDL